MLKWLCIGIAAAGLFAGFILIPFIVYRIVLVRTSKEKWGRSCSMPEDEEYYRMHLQGMEWHKKYQSCKSEVNVQSGKYRLAGEYFDFGYDRAVIIIPGRMESCIYSYYFAEPYRVNGYNVLTIDNRAHGESEGRICSLGYKEYKDLIQWAKMLHDSRGCREIVLHGICIGSSTALFALTSAECPSYLSGMVAEGMYTRFYESFRNHMIEQKRPMYGLPVLMCMIRIFSGANVVTDGPYYRIDQLKKPILFLHSREDTYSTPELAEKLFSKCTAPKKIVWFPHGGHSRLRIVDQVKYDEEIGAFLRTMPAM